MTNKQHYRWLISIGFSEEDATNLSGYHPLDEFPTHFWLGMVIALLIALAGLAWSQS